MKGYIEDIDSKLINVSDILNGVSINSNSSTLDTTQQVENNRKGEQSLQFNSNTKNIPADLQVRQEYQNVETLSESIHSILPKIPNPVGYLQELCVKKRLNPPTYGILRQNGPAHNPTFSTFCKVGDHYRVVDSNQKKKGKEMAAREIIMCLNESLDLEEPSNRATQAIEGILSDVAIPERPSEVLNTPFTRIINYVGTLQEMCVRKQLPPPIYGTEQSTGTPNNPSFYIFCEVGPHREVGIGSNKKIAKHLAAEKVLGCIETLNPEEKSIEKETGDADNNENLSTGKCVETLRDTTIDHLSKIPNPVGHLQELCVKNRLAPPLYGIVKVDGPPHCPNFSTFCKVASFYEVAASNNKKTGKELAARKILTCLAECKTDSN